MEPTQTDTFCRRHRFGAWNQGTDQKYIVLELKIGYLDNIFMSYWFLTNGYRHYEIKEDLIFGQYNPPLKHTYYSVNMDLLNWEVVYGYGSPLFILIFPITTPCYFGFDFTPCGHMGCTEYTQVAQNATLADKQYKIYFASSNTLPSGYTATSWTTM